MNILNIQKTSPQDVLVQDVPKAPGPFCMSFGFEPAFLTHSMQQIGLINIPILVQAGPGLEIISGFQRVLAAQALGWSQIPCRILDEKDFSGLECLLINLHENMSVRRFNDIEKGMILSRLSKWVPPDYLIRTYLPLLNLSSRKATLNLYLGLDQILEQEIKESLVTGRISLHSVARLLGMDQESRSAIHQAITLLCMNHNQQKNLIDRLLDISYQRNMGMREVLRLDALQLIFNDHKMNTPQKATALLKALREELFPRLCRAEKSFSQTMAAIKPPKGIRITYPSCFEGSQYQMAVDFKNGKELIVKLKEMLDREGAWVKLRDPGEEEG